jgi:hypothetical protein
MSDRYAYARERVAAKLAEFNTGAITLTRTTRAAPNPATPHIPGAVTTTDVYSLDARADGVAAEYVNGTTILATDLMVIAAPPADIIPRLTDTLSIDGAPKTIKKIEAVPAAGPPARFHIFVAS